MLTHQTVLNNDDNTDKVETVQEWQPLAWIYYIYYMPKNTDSVSYICLAHFSHLSSLNNTCDIKFQRSLNIVTFQLTYTIHKKSVILLQHILTKSYSQHDKPLWYGFWHHPQGDYYINLTTTA